MEQKDLKKRAKEFAFRAISLVEALPKAKTADVLGRQLLRSGTSVGANYRSAYRAKSPPDFIAKMGIVEEEADESIYWMELLLESGLIHKDEIDDLLQEADEIVAITVSSIKTARTRKKSR